MVNGTSHTIAPVGGYITKPRGLPLGISPMSLCSYIGATVIKRENGMPVANWYDMMKVNSTAADAILDRIVHTAQRFELKGDSLRKK